MQSIDHPRDINQVNIEYFELSLQDGLNLFYLAVLYNPYFGWLILPNLQCVVILQQSLGLVSTCYGREYKQRGCMAMMIIGSMEQPDRQCRVY